MDGGHRSFRTRTLNPSPNAALAYSSAFSLPTLLFFRAAESNQPAPSLHKPPLGDGRIRLSNRPTYLSPLDCT